MLDAVVIGAGQAGLATSYFLKQHGLEHLVFERGEVGESWRSQRWDSFVLNTLNSMNGLPGAPWEGSMPDGFCTAGELAESFASYAKRFDLPVRAGATVTSVEQAGPNGAFVLRMTNGEGAETFDTRTVIIASGIMSAPNIPGMADSVPAGIVQRHAADYRNPADLPAGAVVVVGAGQSGCQIAEDLLDAGRKVYLCVSKVGRCPRRYRGRDIDDWLQDFGGWDVTREELADPAEVFVPQPQVSGVGRYGRSVSLQQLARDGAVLLGRISAVENNALLLEDNVAGCIRHADEVSATIKQKVEDYLAREGIEPPPHEDDPARHSSRRTVWTCRRLAFPRSSGPPDSRLIFPGSNCRLWTNPAGRRMNAACRPYRGSISSASRGCTSASRESSMASRRMQTISLSTSPTAWPLPEHTRTETVIGQWTSSPIPCSTPWRCRRC
jgi:putative flavoprotein involved in K+ transport